MMFLQVSAVPRDILVYSVRGFPNGTGRTWPPVQVHIRITASNSKRQSLASFTNMWHIRTLHSNQSVGFLLNSYQSHVLYRCQKDEKFFSSPKSDIHFVAFHREKYFLLYLFGVDSERAFSERIYILCTYLSSVVLFLSHMISFTLSDLALDEASSTSMHFMELTTEAAFLAYTPSCAEQIYSVVRQEQSALLRPTEEDVQNFRVVQHHSQCYSSC